ncbi:MAG: SMP-30/gluconolactonase/LRE family protein, partial [Planctomycetota bacterium]
WLADREPVTLAALRRLDGASTLRGVVAAGGPRLAAAGLATAAIGLILAIGEVPVTARLQPAGFEAITASILNAMHYQRPDIVLVALLAFLALTVVTAVVAASSLIPLRRVLRSITICGGALVLASLGGCLPVDPAVIQPVNTEVSFGIAGGSLGQFNYPRAIAIDRMRGFVYVVDKNARVQRFDTSGEPQVQWKMPEMELGKPTGLNVAPDGTVYVADTHYFRVIAYTPEGEEILRFGSYGEDPGEFIYTTDVEFGPQGNLFVSEYGGNDRVQVFTPEGELLYAFGSFGDGEGQFRRPQSLMFNEERTELYVADACNHRIVVVDREGATIRVIGESGRGAGQLLYPYDLTMLDDGTLLVCEFGNNRVQRFTQSGEALGQYGGNGRQEGQLMYPWGVDRTEDSIFILDSGNHRVQIVDEL